MKLLPAPSPGPKPVPAPIPVAIVPRTPYTPILSPLERKAYQIAHRLIMGAIWQVGGELAAEGGRRTAQVDAIAKVIMEELKSWR